MNLIIGIVCWISDNRELPELKRCLDSLKDFKVILVDGKWNDMEGSYNISTPEAYQLIESYDNVIHILSPNKPEFYNRNICLRMAGKLMADYMIIVDTDEYVELPKGLDYFKERLEETFKNPRDMVGRVFFDNGTSRRIIRYPMFVRMRLKHNEWFFNDINVRANPLPPTEGLIIHHDKQYRSEERRIKMLNRNRSNPIH